MAVSVKHADLIAILTLIDACCEEVADEEISVGALDDAIRGIKEQATRLAILVQQKRLDLKMLADFPISHKDNMDAHNMAIMAHAAYLSEAT